MRTEKLDGLPDGGVSGFGFDEKSEFYRTSVAFEVLQNDNRSAGFRERRKGHRFVRTTRSESGRRILQ